MSGFCFAYNVRMLSTAAPRFILGLGTGACRQKLLPTMVAAKVEHLSIAFDVECSCFVYSHSTDGVFGCGLRFFHGHVSFLVVLVSCLFFFGSFINHGNRAPRCFEGAFSSPTRLVPRWPCFVFVRWLLADVLGPRMTTATTSAAVTHH